MSDERRRLQLRKAWRRYAAKPGVRERHRARQKTEAAKATHLKWRRANRIRIRQAGRKYKMRWKVAALQTLGGRCVGHRQGEGCPWKCEDPRLLTFDHIYADGYLNKRRSRSELRGLLADGTIKDRIQVLCLYCHALKSQASNDYQKPKEDRGRPDLPPLLELMDG